MWDIFKDTINRIQSKYISLREIRANKLKKHAWYNRKIKRQIDSKKRAPIKYKQTGLQTDLRKCRKERNSLGKIIRNSKRN